MVGKHLQKCIIHGAHSERLPQKNIVAKIMYSRYDKDELFLYLEESIKYENKTYNCAVATLRSKSYNNLNYNITFFYIESSFKVCADKISELNESWRGGLAGTAGISFPRVSTQIKNKVCGYIANIFHIKK